MCFFVMIYHVKNFHAPYLGKHVEVPQKPPQGFIAVSDPRESDQPVHLTHHWNIQHQAVSQHKLNEA